MNLAALPSDWSWQPDAEARRTSIDFAAPGCLATRCVSALLFGVQVMREPMGRQERP